MGSLGVQTPQEQEVLSLIPQALRRPQEEMVALARQRLLVAAAVAAAQVGHGAQVKPVVATMLQVVLAVVDQQAEIQQTEALAVQLLVVMAVRVRKTMQAVRAVRQPV
jgi:hypothetical protein